jgi:DNA-directed RNA polymerase specialized sigma24 family protein
VRREEVGVAEDVQPSPPEDAEPATVDGAAVDPDAELLVRLRSGDEAAFTELVDRWSAPMLRVALIHTRMRALAEEAVQDTWLAVLQGVDRFEGRSSLRTWVFRILLYTCRGKAERERRVPPISDVQRSAGEQTGRRALAGRPLPALGPPALARALVAAAEGVGAHAGRRAAGQRAATAHLRGGQLRSRSASGRSSPCATSRAGPPRRSAGCSVCCRATSGCCCTGDAVWGVCGGGVGWGGG